MALTQCSGNKSHHKPLHSQWVKQLLLKKYHGSCCVSTMQQHLLQVWLCPAANTPKRGKGFMHGFGSFPFLPPQSASLSSLYQAKAALTSHKRKSSAFSSSSQGRSTSILIPSKQVMLPDSHHITLERESACHFFCK